MTTDRPTPEPVSVLVSRVAEETGAVRKGEHNRQGGYAFRGIDAVVNASSAAFRRHQVIVSPEVLDYTYGSVEVGKNRTQMAHVTVRVAYTFTGPAGDSLRVVVPGEAMDSGDKATAKAMSVALRIALLQTLMLPTDEPDPDSHHYERASAAPPPRNAGQARADLARWAQGEGFDLQDIARRWEETFGTALGAVTDPEPIDAFREALAADLERQAKAAGEAPNSQS